MIKRIDAVRLGILLLTVWCAAPLLAEDASDHAATQPAAAAEEQAGESHGESPTLFTGDLGNIFWSLLTFAAVILVLGKFAWGPVLTALQKREEFIRDSLAKAKADREAAEARLAEYEQRIDASRAEATAIVDEGRRDAEVVKNRIQSEARSEAEAMLVRAKREIGIARDTAVSELYGITAGLATDVAGRIIGKELDPAAHEQLVAEAIESVGKLGPGGP